MTKEDGQGDCFVPRNDGKSPTLLNAANNELRVDSSLREKPGKKVLYFTKCLKGFSWQSSKPRAPQSRKKTDKEIASFLAMTAKARWYTIP